MNEEKYMELAIAEAAEGMRNGDGGPFGAIIVKDGKIIGRGHNTVLLTNDPTAHAEVNAIRDACSRLGHHHLSGAVIYSNFEPCPMCLSAIYWADIRELRFSSGREDAENAGFMDRKLYEEVCKPGKDRELECRRIESGEMKALLAEWKDKPDRILY